VTSVLEVIAKPALIGWSTRLEKERAIRVATELYTETQNGFRITPAGYRMTLQSRLQKRASDEVLDLARDIGNEAHSLIEWELRRELGEEHPSPPPPSSPQVARLVGAWGQWRWAVQLRPIAVEQVVWSSQYGYAGSMDLFGELEIPGIGRARAVLDWKSGRGIYTEALLQNAAYGHAVVERELAEPPVHGLIVRLPKTDRASVETRVIPMEEQRKYFDAFKAALELWKFLRALEGKE
jgi:hypothetical protein